MDMIIKISGDETSVRRLFDFLTASKYVQVELLFNSLPNMQVIAVNENTEIFAIAIPADKDVIDFCVEDLGLDIRIGLQLYRQGISIQELFNLRAEALLSIRLIGQKYSHQIIEARRAYIESHKIQL